MSAPIKTIYTPEHARMLKALTDEGAVLVYHRSGPTWNDGGAWHRIVARLTDGTHVSIKMESDYAPDVLIVEPLKQWPPMDDKDARIAELERQLAEARDQALEDAAISADAMMETWAEATYQTREGAEQNAAKVYAAGDIAAAIRALADQDALAEVQALRKDRDAETKKRNDAEKVAIGLTLSLEATDAEVARLWAALNVALGGCDANEGAGHSPLSIDGGKYNFCAKCGETMTLAQAKAESSAAVQRLAALTSPEKDAAE